MNTKLLHVTLTVLFSAIALPACAGDEGPNAAPAPVQGASNVEPECVDADGDGAGFGCDVQDCDDDDASVAEDCGALPPPACAQGESRECKVELGEHDGVKSCWVGVQICDRGAWQPCGQGA